MTAPEFDGTLVGRAEQKPAQPLVLAVVLGFMVVLPFLMGYVGAPAGRVFGGTLKALGDESVYLSAVRQGGEGSWLWRDQFMVRTPAPVVSYLTYMAAGHVGALLGVPVAITYVALHPLAALILFGALWILASSWLEPSKRPWFVLFALGMSGLYWLDGLLAAFGHEPASLPWMAMPPLSGLTSALMGVHETIGTAGQVMLIHATLLAKSPDRRPYAGVAYGAAGSLLVSLTLPMLVPLSALAMGACFMQSAVSSRALSNRGTYLLGLASRMALIISPGLLAAAYYYWQLTSGGWAAGTLRYVGGRPFVEQLLQWGVVVPLAAWGWYCASPSTRPLANVLGIWCCSALICMNLPFWQAFRFSTGLTTMAGGLFALGVLSNATTIGGRRRALLVASLGAITNYLFITSLLASGAYPALYTDAGRQQAMQWLGTHTSGRDVVLAPLGFSNQLLRYSRARVVAGHGQVTFDMPLRERQLNLFFSTGTSPAGRLTVLRASGADLVVYDASDLENGAYMPPNQNPLRQIYANGEVKVFTVTAGTASG